jgi:hypothetical protein
LFRSDDVRRDAGGVGRGGDAGELSPARAATTVDQVETMHAE